MKKPKGPLGIEIFSSSINSLSWTTRKKEKRTDHSPGCITPSMKVFRIPNLDEPPPKPPEYDLVSAVLHRALLDILSDDSHIQNAAYRWCLAKERNLPGCFSFHQCCYYLDICPAFLRRQVLDLYDLVQGQGNVIQAEAFFKRLQDHSKNRYR